MNAFLIRTSIVSALVTAACGCFQDEAADADRPETSERHRGLPDLSSAPNIQAAIAALEASGTVLPVDAVAVTNQLAFQVYQCTGTAWTLRTPLATLTPDQPRRRGFSSLVEANHYRSDFGRLLSDTQREQIGLKTGNVFINRPVWDFTFGGDDAGREIVAAVVGPGQPVADANGPGNVPQLFLTIQGSFTDRAYPSPIVSTTHMLRWTTSGGTAPATPCDAALVNAVVEVPYSAEYYFLTAR